MKNILEIQLHMVTVAAVDHHACRGQHQQSSPLKETTCARCFASPERTALCQFSCNMIERKEKEKNVSEL